MKMKIIKILAAFLMLSVSVFGQSDIVGTWKIVSQNSIKVEGDINLNFQSTNQFDIFTGCMKTVNSYT